MHGIDSERIDMTVANPVQRTFDKKAANLVAVRTVEIDGFAPRCFIKIGKVGPEVSEVVALRSQVVVNHIQHHRQPLCVTGVDQSFETLQSTV